MHGVRKAYEITDARIQFVSLVDKAANRRRFLLRKANDGTATFTTFGRIVRKDAEYHYVTGIVYEPMAEDTDGNFMTEEEITKAAYYFAKNGDKVDLQHSFEPLDGAAVVENWVAKADFEIDGEKVQKGTWLMTVEVPAGEVWDGIAKGDISGFSMGGVGNYSEEDVELDSVSKQQENREKKGLLKQLAAALGLNVVEKGAMAELYEERSKGTLFWNAFNSLEEILYSYDNITGRWRYESDEDRVRECLEEFGAIITSILTGKESITKAIQTDQLEHLAKAGKKMSGRNRETLKGIYESLGVFLKEFEDQDDEDDPDKKEKEDEEVTKQEVEDVIKKAVEVAVAKTLDNGNAQEGAEGGGNSRGAVQKDGGEGEAITQETVEKMVQEAIVKAMEPSQEPVTAEQVQKMIDTAVTKAVDPILKSRGLPSNLNDAIGAIEKQEDHYLHGIV